MRNVCRGWVCAGAVGLGVSPLRVTPERVTLEQATVQEWESDAERGLLDKLCTMRWILIWCGGAGCPAQTKTNEIYEIQSQTSIHGCSAGGDMPAVACCYDHVGGAGGTHDDLLL